MECKKCGKVNLPTAEFCVHCGTNVPPAYGPDEHYKAVLGASNSNYYLGIFKDFDAAGKGGVTWHWPAFFATFFWLLYRKLWLDAAIYFIFPIVLLFAIAFMGAKAGPLGGVLFLVYLLATVIVPPLFANARYYARCRAKIADAKAAFNDEQRQLSWLWSRGGTSNAVVIVAALAAFVLPGMLAAIAIPAYQDYTNRAKMQAIYLSTQQAGTAVSLYYAQHQKLPADLAQAGYAEALPKGATKLAFDADSGDLAMSVQLNKEKDPTTLLLRPFIDEQNAMQWNCSSPDMKPQMLPPKCRPPK